MAVARSDLEPRERALRLEFLPAGSAATADFRAKRAGLGGTLQTIATDERRQKVSVGGRGVPDSQYDNLFQVMAPACSPDVEVAAKRETSPGKGAAR